MIPRGPQDGFGAGGRGVKPSHQPSRPGSLHWSSTTPPGLPPACGRHPLADQAISRVLHNRSQEINAAFNAIEPVLCELAPHQFEEGFARRATAKVLSQLHLDFPADLFDADWTAPLDMAALHARCILATFCRLIEHAFDRSLALPGDGGSVEDLVQRWGFHAIDISPCADGRLAGVIDYILRIPPGVVACRKAYAGALFEIEESVRRWESTELRRWRQAVPNAAVHPTQYLKISIYHFSSSDPQHQGCAAHGNDDDRAATALLKRLRQFALAVRLLHGEGTSVATLLVGVDTDTDTIRVHVPDSQGNMHAARHLNSHILYNRTTALPREAAKGAIRNAVAACAGVSVDDNASAGMRRFCGYLLENNIAQIDLLREWQGGRSQGAEHTERLIIVGDAVDEVPLRNIAFQAQMSSLEEDSADLDTSVAILRSMLEERRLAIPVLVHLRADPLMPGSVQRAQLRANRLVNSIRQRYVNLVSRGRLHIQAVIHEGDGALVPVQLEAATS